MWEAGKMGLVFVGPESSAPINSLAVHANTVFASTGQQVIRYLRGKEVTSYDAPEASSTLGQIMIFGEQLLALKEDGTGLIVWSIETGDVEGEITFHSSFTATTMLHPATYLNKIIVGSQQGDLQLWNIRTQSLIHSFSAPSSSSASGITIITQSPAVDVLGIGYQDGTIRIMDIKQGEDIFKFKMDEGGIAGLTFRMEGPAILASSSTNGTIAIWDLQERGKVLHTIRDAHEAAVTGLQWVAGQPLLISSSGDNSIKQWVCDADNAIPRLLKSRSGHHAPLSCIRYYGEDGKQILTAGRDRALRYTSVVRDSRSHELSQGSMVKKANALSVKAMSLKFQPITAMSSSSTRSKDWEDVVTAHVEDGFARTWRVQEKRAGRWSFDVADGTVKAVAVTACGNYGLAGSSTGHIKMWNMQSGQERKTFYLSGAPLLKLKAGKARKAVTPGKAVTGLATDSLNRTVVASTLDGVLHFFDFHSTALDATMTMPSNVTAISLHRDSGLLAVVCDDLVLRVIDIETRRIVRELSGFRGRVLDTAFSPDSRWLVTTSLDGVIRTFDVPTGQLVDAFRPSSIATSLTFSPTGDFLATAHVDSVGVYLWANKAQFTEVSLRHIDESSIFDVAMPSAHGVDDDAGLVGITPVGQAEHHDIYTTPDQLTEELLTLSLVPRSRWQTLLNLETIKQRNKPQQPPKAPEQAPFFLPQVQGLETRFDLDAGKEGVDAAAPTAMQDLFAESEFTRRLGKEDAEGNYQLFFEYIKGLSPAAIDLEIRSLLSLQHLESFLRALIGRLRSNRDFEAIQAFISVCVSVHGDIMVSNEELQATLEELLQAQEAESKRLMELISFSLGTLSFVRK